MSEFIKYTQDQKTVYINADHIERAEFDASDGTLILNYPGKNVGEHDVYLRGPEATRAKTVLDRLAGT